MFERALQIDPKNADTYNSKGVLFEFIFRIRTTKIGKM